jgi:hypothetical protein
MIVFTNPITMTNKTYHKSYNTRTNNPECTPQRKGSSTPGKVSAAKLLWSTGGQEKMVQQTLQSSFQVIQQKVLIKSTQQMLLPQLESSQHHLCHRC